MLSKCEIYCHATESGVAARRCLYLIWIRCKSFQFGWSIICATECGLSIFSLMLLSLLLLLLLLLLLSLMLLKMLLHCSSCRRRCCYFCCCWHYHCCGCHFCFSCYCVAVAAGVADAVVITIAIIVGVIVISVLVIIVLLLLLYCCCCCCPWNWLYPCKVAGCFGQLAITNCWSFYKRALLLNWDDPMSTVEFFPGDQHHSLLVHRPVF